MRLQLVRFLANVRGALLPALALATWSAHGAAAAGSAPENTEGLREEGNGVAEYRALLRRDSYGIAHIEADEYGSLGYGEGYAAAEDHVCNIAWSLLEARGELARYFGEGSAQSRVNSDAVVKAMDISGQARAALAQLSPTLRRWLIGYSDGYNRYLTEHPGASDSAWCSDADWLRAASPVDFMARMVLVAQTLPRMSDAVAAAQPPTAGTARLAIAQDEWVAALDAAKLSGMGSNAWALGGDMTENGGGLLLANPHYPWYGSSRFWEKHLTIPGELDVYGVHLLGAPGVAVGFNRAVGWSHTVSASQRLVLYRLRLVDGEPLRYHYGEETRAIEKRRVSVDVLEEDGGVTSRERAIWFSHYGPMLRLPGEGGGWSSSYAYTARDANAGNFSLLAQWQALNSATSMDDFIAAHRRFNAMPWVNTIAASADGRAVYLDNSTVGNLSAEAEVRWRQSLGSDPLAAGLYQQRGMVLLDGSDPVFEWVDDPEAPLPGTVPFARRPMLERADYVFNANDSYWLSSPRQPLTGFPLLYGATDAARSLRTRMNIRLLENRYGDAGENGLFNRREVQRALFANRGLGAELLLPELVQACVASGAPDLAEACRVLARYDGTVDLDSPGAVLFREWLTRYAYAETTDSQDLFREAFDPGRPESTPAGLGDRERALKELRGAVAVLDAADLALDADLRKAQFAWRAGQAIPVHGGLSREGVANLQMSGTPGGDLPSDIAGVTPAPVADSRYLTDAGYPVIHGSSFIMTLAFEDGAPVAEAVLSYSQSGDPGSAHFIDQTILYAREGWRPVAFTPAQVEADTSTRRELRSRE